MFLSYKNSGQSLKYISLIFSGRGFLFPFSLIFPLNPNKCLIGEIGQAPTCYGGTVLPSGSPGFPSLSSTCLVAEGEGTGDTNLGIRSLRSSQAMRLGDQLGAHTPSCRRGRQGDTPAREGECPWSMTEGRRLVQCGVLESLHPASGHHG